jgi:hypothetical protein
MIGKRKAAVIEAFGDIPLDSQYVDFLYARRHLAKLPDPHFPNASEPQYIAEYFELEAAIGKKLAEIRERDGVEIFEEVREGLIDWLEIKGS